MKTPQIIIEVSGGVVQSVYSHTPCKIVILDHDNAKDGDKDNLPMSTEALYDDLSAGDYIRKQARELFGRGMAKDWFN